MSGLGRRALTRLYSTAVSSLVGTQPHRVASNGGGGCSIGAAQSDVQ